MWGAPVSTHDQVERHERLRLGAEAMRQLKPQETRCLLLLAEGHSYKQICAITGWSYTKVNRSVTEGRRSFLRRVRGIESGAECERMAPLLSALADGEASARELTVLRPHLRGCLCCKATLRDFRAAPAPGGGARAAGCAAAHGVRRPRRPGRPRARGHAGVAPGAVLAARRARPVPGGGGERAEGRGGGGVDRGAGRRGAATASTVERPEPAPRVERVEPRERRPASQVDRPGAVATSATGTVRARSARPTDLASARRRARPASAPRPRSPAPRAEFTPPEEFAPATSRAAPVATLSAEPATASTGSTAPGAASSRPTPSESSNEFGM